MTIAFNHITLQNVVNLVCTKLKGEQMECDMLNSFEKALPFRYIYKGRLVKIDDNIAF